MPLAIAVSPGSWRVNSWWNVGCGNTLLPNFPSSLVFLAVFPTSAVGIKRSTAQFTKYAVSYFVIFWLEGVSLHFTSCHFRFTYLVLLDTPQRMVGEDKVGDDENEKEIHKLGLRVENLKDYLLLFFIAFQKSVSFF